MGADLSKVKVITYGTYDYLHYGHIRLLERAKELGDYLIVGVTASGFDETRGKINVQQSLMERIDAVRATGIADEVIVEEYEGQKIDDIRRYGIDVFTVGSDWEGRFDYLKEYCKVVYLDRTEGVSSTSIRAKKRLVRMGFVGDVPLVAKHVRESSFVNGLKATALCSGEDIARKVVSECEIRLEDDYTCMLDGVDAVYVASLPRDHGKHVRMALEKGVHVLCESPIATNVAETKELMRIASERGIVLMEALKTAYATAFHRLVLLIKSGRIGDVVSINATCTSLTDFANGKDSYEAQWSSMCDWGPTALLAAFRILGTKYLDSRFVTWIVDHNSSFDAFTKMDFIYPSATVSLMVGKGVKSEGDMVVSGTRGYVYVPAPWWKTEYFELRYENPAENKRYFYQLDGEGIRYELVSFVSSIEKGLANTRISYEETLGIAKVLQDYYAGNGVAVLS